MTMSLSITVGTLCATVTTVQSANSSLMILWMIASVAESMEAVASSNTNILFLFNKTLPRQNSCLCPTLQFSPSSLTSRVKKKTNKKVLSIKRANKPTWHLVFVLNLKNQVY